MMRLATLAILTASLALTTPAHSQSGRSVLLVLDASGSMNAKLPDGQTRIETAKRAVSELVGRMDGATRLALRAYGHQSPTQSKDCKDTALLANFAPVSENKTEIVAKAKIIEARGYTPISHSLTLAAQDFANEEAAERIVVLVSDGHETCAADPCVAAKALAAADAKLAIHAIGFGVGTAARTQLQCIANVARGSYFDAGSARDLAAMLATAASTKPKPDTGSTVTVDTSKPGRIQVKNTWAGYVHAVTKADGGQMVVEINGAGGQAEVPPGVYNVGFVNGLWRGVEVKAGRTTVLEVGRLEIEGGPSDLAGYTLLDPETEAEIVSRTMIAVIPLMPTSVVVSSGHLAWPSIEIKTGQTSMLRPARIKVTGQGTYKVTTEDGRMAGEVSQLFNLPLPPGRYVVEIGDQKLAVQLSEGQNHMITVR